MYYDEVWAITMTRLERFRRPGYWPPSGCTGWVVGRAGKGMGHGGVGYCCLWGGGLPGGHGGH